MTVAGDAARAWLGKLLRWPERAFHRQLILLFTVVCLVPLALSNGWGYLQSRRYLVELAVQNVQSVAALEASQALELVEDDRRLLPTILAGNEHLARLLAAAADQPTSTAALAAALERHLTAKAAESQRLASLWALSPRGDFLAAADGRPTARSLAPACLAKAKSGRAFAEVRPGEGGPELLVASTVAGERGRPLGILCATFSIDAIRRELLHIQQQRIADATVLLVDRAGRAMTGSVEENGTNERKIQLAIAGLPVGGAAAWQGRITLGADGDLLAAYSPVPNLTGGVLVTVPTARALASLERLKWQALVSGVLLAATLMLLVLLVARAITQPLKALSRATSRAADGELAQVEVAGGSAEIAELARTFNRMSAALKATHESLEARIAERTRDLEHSREFADLLLNSIDQAVTVIDGRFRVVQANRAAVAMYGPGIIGSACHDALAECRDAPDVCPGCETFREGRACTREQSIRLGDRQEILSVQTFPIRNPKGDVKAVVRMGRIVTGEKRMQAQMVHNERMAAFGLLAAGVAHEIGNPLASIESQLGLARRIPEPGRVEQTLGIVEREVQRIARLLRELVDFSRKRRSETTLVSINDVVEDIARLLAHDPRARGVDIERRLAPGLPGVRAKEDQLVQVLLNLGINALDAIHGTGRVVFETVREDGAIVVRVRDTGGGIAPDTRGRIFEPFFTTKEAGRGTGLGLFVSRGIVEGLSGSLVLESSSGEGTVFAAHLPIESHPISAENPVPVGLPHREPSGAAN